MTLITAPQEYAADRKTVFLAGSIDMGRAEHWQPHVAGMCTDVDVQFLSLRREVWKESEAFLHEQVTWELAGMEHADVIFMNLLPESQSPISLLEFGPWVRSEKMIIVCPRTFWRAPNIRETAARYGTPVHETVEEGVAALRARLVA